MLKGLLTALTTTGAIAGTVAGLAAVVGLTLPEQHQIARSARIGAPPATVFKIIANVAGYPDWRSDVSKVELQPGDDAFRFTEYSTERPEPIRYRIESADPPRLLRITTDDDSLPFGGTWTYLLQPFDSGTSVTITEDGRIRNPIFRVIAKVLFSPTDSMDLYLHDLSVFTNPKGGH